MTLEFSDLRYTLGIGIQIDNRKHRMNQYSKTLSMRTREVDLHRFDGYLCFRRSPRRSRRRREEAQLFNLTLISWCWLRGSQRLNRVRHCGGVFSRSDHSHAWPAGLRANIRTFRLPRIVIANALVGSFAFRVRRQQFVQSRADLVLPV